MTNDSTRDGSNRDADTDDVLKELARLPNLASPRASPDGETVACYYDVSGRNEIHLLDPETGELEQLSDGEVPRSVKAGFRWSADGDRLFFHRDEDGDEQHDIHAIDLEGGTETVVAMDGQIYLQDVGEDGETLLVASNRDGQMNVYRHDLSAGETTKITDYERAARGAVLSPDCERFAYATNESDDYDNYDVYVADVDGSNARNLEIGEIGAEASPADWHPDGDRLLVGDNSTDLNRCGIYDLEADEVTWFGEGEYEESPGFFLPDGEAFVAMRVRDVVAVPVVYDLEGEARGGSDSRTEREATREIGDGREFDLPDGVARAAERPLADGSVLCYHTSATRRPELLAYDLASDAFETVLEAEYGPFDPDDFVEPEHVTFTSDGVPETPARAVDHDPYEAFEIDALLFDSGRRPSPLIVNPHGGPRARDVKRFSYRVQFLLSRGFSVLQVNYRGSSGRGREFVEELYDDWGGAEQGDVATGAEHVLAEYDWLDDDRVVVYGGSYGGYSANWQMVQYPDLYDAGIAWVGLSDLEEMYETTMPHFRTELMEKNLGTPEENPEIYAERSPVTYAENLAAPLLLVHGVNDPRVPVSQARIFRDALEAAGYEEGTDYEYEELGEEGHGSSDIDQKIRSLELLDDFLERCIGTAEGDAAALDD